MQRIPTAIVRRLVHVLAQRTIQQNAYILRVIKGALRTLGHSIAGNFSKAPQPRPAEEMLEGTEERAGGQSEVRASHHRRPSAGYTTPETKHRNNIKPHSARRSQSKPQVNPGVSKRKAAGGIKNDSTSRAWQRGGGAGCSSSRRQGGDSRPGGDAVVRSGTAMAMSQSDVGCQLASRLPATRHRLTHLHALFKD